MDDSEETIKMCEEAEELRRSWVPRVGDRPLLKLSEKTSVWIPTQDELQDMLEEKNPIMVHADFSRFVNVWLDIHQQDIEPTTMTRLWLEYVMKKNYNKIWVNGHWI